MTPRRRLTHACCHPASRFPAIGLMAMAALNSHAQDAGDHRAVAIVPSFSLTQTFTDNARLNADKRFEAITQLRPGVHISSNAGRIQGALDYTLNGVIHARDSSASNLQHALSAFVRAEAIENWAYLDASASISQQNIAALGTQSPDAALNNPNRTEVSSFNITPYVRGSLAGVADYEARLNYAGTNSDTSNADSTTSGAVLRLSSDRRWGRLGWFADASHQEVDFRAGRETESDRLNAGLSFVVGPELSLSARGGREINNLVSVDRQSHVTSGFGLAWNPTERTRLVLDRDRRYFGHSHSVRFEHRTPKTVWKFVDVRDVSSGAASNSIANPVSVFDLLFTQLASEVPDPALRTLAVNDIMQRMGISPNALAVGGFLTAASSLQRRQELSFALLGLRSTVTVSAFRTEGSRLDTQSTVVDDLANGNVLRQRGLSVNVSHRLTPESSIILSATQLNTSATVGDRSTRLRTGLATWTSRISKRTQVSLGARHARFASTTTPYTESALIGTLTLRF